MVIQRAINLKLFPNDIQKIKINNTLGSCRFVHNHFLGLSENKNYKGYTKNSKSLTELKQAEETSFLKEIDKFALQNTLKDLDASFKNFFDRRTKYPKFKTKKGKKQKNTYRTNFTNDNIKLTRTALQLPKLGKIRINKDFNKQKIDFDKIVKLVNVTVKKTRKGFYAKVLVEYKLDIKIKEPSNYIVGVDVGVKNFFTLSNGFKLENPKYLKDSLNKLAKLQKKVSKCVEGSNNQAKLYLQITKLHEKVANQRKDFHHKKSKKLIDENQVIVIEDFTINSMMKDLDNSNKSKNYRRALLDSGLHQFKRFLEYKAIWYGRTLIKANKYFASTQLCHSCGHKNTKLKNNLTIRKWTCPECNTIHDRDINASKNLELYGLAQLNQTAQAV